MYYSKENKRKVFLSLISIALSTASIIGGKTLATDIILTKYSTTVLPYFYVAFSLLLIITTLITSRYQEKYQEKFDSVTTLVYLVLLLFFMLTINSGIIAIPFIASVLILCFCSIIAPMSWNYASDIFTFQEFKQYGTMLQVSSSVGAIVVGALIAVCSINFNPIIILMLLFVIELMCLFCIKPLAQYLPPPTQVVKKSVNFTPKLRSNSIYKYLAVLSMLSMIVSALIDYSFKLSLSATIAKAHLASIINLIYVISIPCTLIFQVFFLDYLLRTLGSKKIIMIYPVAIFITGLIAWYSLNFIWIVVLYLVNDLLTYTTVALAKNLYGNILPRALRSAARIKLNGIIKPFAWIVSSFIIWEISLTSSKIMLCIILVIIFSVCSIYLAKILIKNYILQLNQSVYLRRFKPELINMAQIDKGDITYLLENALSYPDPEAKLYALQLLANNQSKHLPDSLSSLLTDDNSVLIKEAARLLSLHRKQRQFEKVALSAFLKSSDEETRWYLALYLIKEGESSFLHWTSVFLQNKSSASLALACLVFLKQGDIQQHIVAMNILTKMLSSMDKEQEKWFLLVLGEVSFLKKEQYIIRFINDDNFSIQALAMHYMTSNPSKQLLNSVLNNIGSPHISHAVSTQLIQLGEKVIDPIENKLYNSTSYRVKISCIQIISQILGTKSELCLINFLSKTDDIFLKTTLAKSLAFRGVKLKIGSDLKNFLIDAMKNEVHQFYLLTAQLIKYDNLIIVDEINSRLTLIKKRILYFLAAIIGSLNVLNSVSLLASSKQDKTQQALALEIIDATSENRVIPALLMRVFIDIDPQKIITDEPFKDRWLTNYIQKIEGNNVESIYTLSKLRKVELFKTLPAETIQVLSECCSSRDMVQGEIIFREGDQGDGLYIIDSGEVVITKQGIEINRLAEYAYFGELALLSDTVRFATVKAVSDGVLFYIDRQDFDRITDEIPEIMKNINKQIINYLTGNASALAQK